MYLPSGPAHASWILWLEAWARAAHSREVTRFLEELLAPWLEMLAETVAGGVRAGEFAAPADVGDFTLRFSALLDGFAIQRMRQMHQPARARLVRLALTTAGAELAPAAA